MTTELALKLPPALITVGRFLPTHPWFSIIILLVVVILAFVIDNWRDKD